MEASTDTATEPVRTSTPEPHPALLELAERHAASIQKRVADVITSFAGSMWFVYLHATWFVIWITLPVEKYPFGLLTMVVSLEAIFISTFIMISQNQADAKREVLANHQWQTVQIEERQNEQLIQLSNQIRDLTVAVHSVVVDPKSGSDQGVHA